MADTVETRTTGAGSAGHEARMEQFRDEIGRMRLKGGSGENEQRLMWLGVVLVVAGIALAVAGAVRVASLGGSPADQRAAMASGSLLGLALIVPGAALYVRYSLARYLRFWLVRLTYEGRADADRVVDAIERAAGIEPGARTAAGAPAPPAGAAAPPAPPSGGAHLQG